MTWETLARTHNSPYVKSTAIWFAILPLIAALSTSPPIDAFVKNIHIPFSWGLLFASACIFFAARICFVAACPALIRDYETWSAFQAREGGSGERLLPFIVDVFNRTTVEEFRSDISRAMSRGYVSLPSGRLDDVNQMSQAAELVNALTVNKPIEMYALIYKRGNLTSRNLRLIVSIVTLSAFALLSIVALQNVGSVMCLYSLLGDGVCQTIRMR